MLNPLDAAIRAIAILTVGLVLTHHAGYFDRVGIVPKVAIQHLDGHEYVIPDVLQYASTGGMTDLLYSSTGDSNDDSQLKLCENGQRIGPAHSIHQHIADQGNGRFSHWSNELRFSSTDNSDPRTNDRTYAITQRAQTARLVVIPALALVVLLAWRRYREPANSLPELRFATAALRGRRFWYGASTCLGLYLVGCYAFGAPSLPLISPDTLTYWVGHEIVPIGYPVFLWTVSDIFGSLKAVIVAQIGLFVIAAITAQSGIERAMGSPAAAGIATVLILTFGAAASTAIWMMSESVFISMLLLHIAAAGYAFARPTRLNLTMLAVTAVACVSIRPAGYFLFGGIVFLSLFWSRRRVMALQWALCPLCGFAIAYYGLNLIVRGQPDQTNLGNDLFPHVAHLYDGPPPWLSSGLAAAIDSPLLRSYQLNRTENHDWLALQNLEQMTFSLLLHDIYRRFGRHGIDVRRSLLQLSIHTITRHPIGYVETVLQNIVAWFHELIFNERPHIGERLAAEFYERPRIGDRSAADFDTYWPEVIKFRSGIGRDIDNSILDEQQRPFIIRHADYIPFLTPPPYLLGAIKIAFVACGAIATIAFVLGYARPATALVAYIAVLAVGGVTLVSLSTVFISRYAIPLDPLVLTTAALGTWRGLTLASSATLRATESFRKHVSRSGVGKEGSRCAELPGS